jgi:hypothetical protein
MTKKILILVILGDIILAAFLVWSFYQFRGLSAQNSLLDDNIENLSFKKRSMLSNKTESGYLDNSILVLKSYFISSDQKIAVIDNLEKIAGRSGITYVLNNAVDGEKVSLDIGVRGSFRDIYYFIRLLEESGYWVSFDKVSLSRNSDREGNWSGSMVINIPNLDK